MVVVIRGLHGKLLECRELTLNAVEPRAVGEQGFYDATAHMATISEIMNSGSTSDRFVWSPNSTTTLTAAAASNQATDWTNSYGIPGFPTVGQNLQTRVFTH